MGLHCALGVLLYQIHFDIRLRSTARSGMARAAILFWDRFEGCWCGFSVITV
jgi:hypothetical protein